MKYVILCDVRSSHNVGAIFRTADGAGVAKIFLCGYTPAPLDRFGRVVGEITKTSLGAAQNVSWEQTDDACGVVRGLQTAGVTVVAIEQTPKAVPLFNYAPPENVAYIFGNEITGVPAAVLALVDAVVEIPMHGQKESLNVSSTVAIVLFQRPV